jgi:pimeloyl-ACP methyl ester carboxylesterase
LPKAKINGLTVHYQQMGYGRDLVMIHGLFSNLAFWYLSVLPALSRNFRVTAYDLRGHGYTDMPQCGYTSFDMASDLHALLDYLGIERAHIVGHSFGGAVGLHYTALYPERVVSLALADARVPSLQPALPTYTARQWNRLSVRLRRAGIEVPEKIPRVAYSVLEELAWLHQRQTGRDAGLWSPAGLLGGWSSNSRVAKRWSHLVRTTSAPEDLCDLSGLTVARIRQVVQPTLAIYGEHSSCLTTLWGLMKHLPNCKKVIVPGAGHFHPVLKPETFVAKLGQFVLGLEG